MQPGNERQPYVRTPATTCWGYHGASNSRGMHLRTNRSPCRGIPIVARGKGSVMDFKKRARETDHSICGTIVVVATLIDVVVRLGPV